MIIEWEVKKKRGHARPELFFVIRLETFEREMGVPQVVVESTIPRPPKEYSSFCLPGFAERAGEACENYRLYTPAHDKGVVEGRCRLPWRESGEYPEIEESFRLLRSQFEAVLTKAYNSEPIDIAGRLEMSSEARNHIVSGVAAQRFLKAVGL